MTNATYSDVGSTSTTQVHPQENTNYLSITVIIGATAATIVTMLIVILFVVTAISIKGGKCHKDNSSTAANNEAHEMTPKNTTVDEDDPHYDYPIIFETQQNVAYATITGRVYRE